MCGGTPSALCAGAGCANASRSAPPCGGSSSFARTRRARFAVEPRGIKHERLSVLLSRGEGSARKLSNAALGPATAHRAEPRPRAGRTAARVWPLLIKCGLERRVLARGWIRETVPEYSKCLDNAGQLGTEATRWIGRVHAGCRTRTHLPRARPSWVACTPAAPNSAGNESSVEACLQQTASTSKLIRVGTPADSRRDRARARDLVLTPTNKGNRDGSPAVSPTAPWHAHLP